MLFNSQAFICGFLPVVLGLYYAMAGSRAARQWLLVVASLVFYGWWDVRFVPLLLGLTIANWLVALWYGASRASIVPVLGVAMNLIVLALFKYADFLRGLAPDPALGNQFLCFPEDFLPDRPPARSGARLSLPRFL
jgi:alginate O-acetyltransferase complex protein AlgI